MKTVKWFYLALILLFLYAPILFMIAMSFNGGNSRAVWGGETDYAASDRQTFFEIHFLGQQLPLSIADSDDAGTRAVAEAVNQAYARAAGGETAEGEQKNGSTTYKAAISFADGALTEIAVSERQSVGFSFRWYMDLFQHAEIKDALVVTLEVAVLATVASTVIGTLAAIGVHAMRARPQNMMMALNNIPLTMPDIVTGISLMLLFIFTGVPRNRWTMLLAHITFDVPYVILSVMPKLRQMNPNTYEAALDLGSTPIHALFHVILPAVMPGVITGAMLAFTLSLDDFTISYFTSPTDQNLATLIYSQSRQGVKLYMYALSTLMFVSLLVLLLVVNKRSSREES